MARKNEMAEQQSIEILQLTRAVATVHVIGVTPLIQNRMTEKAKREFILPGLKPTLATKQSRLKHNPLEEYQLSMHRMPVDGKEFPTLVMMPGVAFKGAMRSATMDMPGASKAAIGRLCYIEEINVPIYGTPMLKGDIVRQGGMKRTPDMRLRAVFPEWAARFTITFQRPLINEKIVTDLLQAAGEIIGVGDYRPEKGAGTFGRWRIVDKKEFDSTIKVIGARKEQLRASENPDFYDDDTRDLIEWFQKEAGVRGLLRRANGKAANEANAS